MPELPEVEVCRRDLQRWTTGRTIVAVDVRDPAVVRRKLSTHPNDALPEGETALRRLLTGARTAELARHGKRIAWWLDGADAGLLLHLGMTGSWRLRPELATHPWVKLALRLDDGGWLWFEDPRRFGCVVPIPEETLREALRGGMGPDALLEPLSATELRLGLRGRRPVKVALMDQCVLAGVGNIHASEACWRARIHPATPCDALGDEAIARLAAVLPEQLRHYTEQMAAEGEHAYVTMGGGNPFDVYDREGEPCPRCGTPIVRDTHAGRSTYWCPACQPALLG